MLVGWRRMTAGGRLLYKGEPAIGDFTRGPDDGQCVEKPKGVVRTVHLSRSALGSAL